MKHTRRYKFILTLALSLLLGLPVLVTVVRAQVLTPRPEELRFQMPD